MVVKGAVAVADREWQVSQPDKTVVTELRRAGFSRVTASLLSIRGVKTATDAKAFFASGEGLFDPMLLKGMPEAVERIARALELGEKITVYGDYDADGVTATALLFSYLRDKGANVSYYIPERESEGYGLNTDAVNKIAQQGTTLVITVDTGISGFEEAALFKSLGVCLIVTDHHEPRGDDLPAAFAVINPKQPGCAYPFKELAGVGVAFRLLCALEKSGGGLSDKSLFAKYGELVCLGTVADVVPLVGENRTLVMAGLKLIAENPGIGLSALLEASGVKGRRLSAVLLSFTLAPRINACGRIASVSDALELLLTKDPQTATQLAQKLDDNNRERREIEAGIVKESIEKIDSNEALRNNPLLIVSGEGWHNGVIGIVASRLVERYGKPAVVVSFDGETGRASCRSIPGFNIHEALSSCAQYLERFGGHELAAGFSVTRENYDALYTALNRIANTLPQLPTLKIRPDLRLRGGEISLSTARDIRCLEPFGSGNPPPLFYIPAAQIIAAAPVGDGHTRITAVCEGFTFNAVQFGTRDGFAFSPPDIVDLAVSLDVNLYKNNETLSVIVRNIRKSACFAYYAGLYRDFASVGAAPPEALRERLKPTRAEFAEVYRYLCRGRLVASLEAACADICRKNSHFNYFKLLLAIDVFIETGLVKTEGDAKDGSLTYAVNNQSDSKIDLAASALLQRLG